MQLDHSQLEDTSIHYYIPGPPALHSLLYYPVSLGYFDCKPGYCLQRNLFRSYLLLVMMTGVLSYHTRHDQGTVRAGQVLLLDCNAPHSYAAQGRCSFTFIHFDGANAKELYEAIIEHSGHAVSVPNITAMHEAIGDMMHTMAAEHRLNEGTTSAQLYGMLMQLLDASGATSSGTVADPTVDRAIAYIQAHLTDRLTVESIAADAGYSASYFSHLFAQETGMSPYQFVVKSRIDRAQQLLQMTRLSVQDVAFQTGFNSAANFCYTFRKTMGISPQEYRKRPM